MTLIAVLSSEDPSTPFKESVRSLPLPLLVKPLVKRDALSGLRAGSAERPVAINLVSVLPGRQLAAATKAQEDALIHGRLQSPKTRNRVIPLANSARCSAQRLYPGSMRSRRRRNR
jgi:hypothetical protein